MLKYVMHLRMITLKMIQQTVTVFDPILEESLASYRIYQKSGFGLSLQPQLKMRDQNQEIMSYKEVENRLEDFQNEI